MTFARNRIGIILTFGGLLGLFGICLPMAVWCIESGINPWQLSWFFLPLSILVIGIGIYLWVMAKYIHTSNKHNKGNSSNDNKRPCDKRGTL